MNDDVIEYISEVRLFFCSFRINVILSSIFHTYQFSVLEFFLSVHSISLHDMLKSVT